jgi:hypothetical protein
MTKGEGKSKKNEGGSCSRLPGTSATPSYSNFCEVRLYCRAGELEMRWQERGRMS